MKKYLLVFTLSLFFIKSFGQYNYYRLSAGGSIGTNVAFADLNKKRPAQTLAFNLDYNLTPFMSIGLEYQNGTLAGGDSTGVEDKNYRYFKNNYSALTLGGKIQLGQVVDFESSNFLYAIRGLYAGIGVGIIKNNMKEIMRVQPRVDLPQTPYDDRLNPPYTFPGVNKSTGIAVPINTGINFNLLDRWGYTRYVFNINYQFNITTGEGLDGYNDASSKNGAFSNIPDMYGVA